MLHRYWFMFKNAPIFSPLNLGCGVTAYSYDDAVGMLSSRVSAGETTLAILNVVENVDVETLDRGHVLPNLGDVAARGIWFPLGY